MVLHLETNVSTRENNEERELLKVSMAVRRELLGGIERLRATTHILQRARVADPLAGMWEAADVQWWWRRPRVTDELALPVWFDDAGPVAAVGLTAWEESCQLDVFSVPFSVSNNVVWSEALDFARASSNERLEILVHNNDESLKQLALSSGFEVSELSGTTWMDAERRPPVRCPNGFAIVDRSTRAGSPHPMISRNGSAVEQRLRQCSLYDPWLDLAIEDRDGRTAGYALYWFDPTTLVGLLEPMRVEDGFQRRGLARALIAEGLDRLAQRGARRFKVGFVTDAARDLYLGAGFVQSSHDLLLTRAPTNAPTIST